jgi:radical SAM protein with 4Fe4S-binding SPASM domain
MLSYFHTLYFETTRRCNFACDNCATGSQLRGRQWGGELTVSQIVDRIFQPAHRLGTRTIIFSGGEFLLRRDAFELLEAANEQGFRVHVVSNGSTLTDHVVARLKALLGRNLKITLGINSFDNEENTETRDVGADSTLTLIDKLKKERIVINVCVAIGKHTAGSLDATIEKINELKVPFNRIPFSPRNSTAHDQMLDRATMCHVVHPALRKYYQGYVSLVPFLVSPATYERYAGQNEQNTRVPTNPSVGCWCGSFYTINPEGEVSVCPMLGDSLSGGNVLEVDLESILFHSDLFKAIVSRKDFGGKCGTCQYNFTCGGCRAMAYYHTGDVTGEDPTCFIHDLEDGQRQALQQEMEEKFAAYVPMSGLGGLYTKP